MSNMKEYIFTGWAKGRFDAQDNRTGETFKKNYFNAYLISPVSDYKSEDYEASGFKAEKYSCLSAEVWKGLSPGEVVNVYFGEKEVIALMTSTGKFVPLDVEELKKN